MEKHYLHRELNELVKTDETIFDFLQKNLFDGLWYWDLEHPENEWMNEKFWTTLGYDPEQMPHQASAWKDIIFNDDLELAMDNLKKHLEDPNCPYDQIVRYVHKNGSTVWIRCYGKAIRNQNGKPIRMMGAHQDITLIRNREALNQARAEVRQKERELKRVQEITHVGSWYLDIASNEVMWTEELFKMYGFDPSLPPPPYNEHQKLFTPESWERLSRALDNTSKTGVPYELELNTVKEDGSRGWMWVRGENVLNEDGKVIGLWGAAQDITERKKIEADLITERIKAEESEEQFRQLFENMEQGYALHKLVYNDKGKAVDYEFILLNKAFESLTKLKSETCVGKTVRQIMPDIEQVWIDNYANVAHTGQSMHFDSYAADLQKHYDVIAYSPKPGYFATVFTDISKIKEYEKELIDAKNKAEESERLKSAFLANMSHEIRTPMNAIIGFASFLKEPNKSPDDIKRYANVISTSGEHLLNLINDIIDISKIDAGQVEVNKAPVFLNRLMKELYNFFHSFLVSKSKYDIHLKLDLPTIEVVANTDEMRLRQILINVIGNATKFTERGVIEFGYRVEENALRFFISDTGIGISEEKREMVFERFRQATDSTEKVFGGTGLGLSIAKACVDLLDGNIWFESKEGKGTKFFFTIAYEPITNYKKKTVEIPISHLLFNNETILIAEDDEYNYEYLKLILEEHKLQVIRAQTGRETIAKVMADNSICLILMDIQMPDINGIDATIAIKRQKPEMHIIAQTAYAFESDKQKFLQIGCDAYISKPINKKTLIELLAKYIPIQSP